MKVDMLCLWQYPTFWVWINPNNYCEDCKCVWYVWILMLFELPCCNFGVLEAYIKNFKCISWCFYFERNAYGMSMLHFSFFHSMDDLYLRTNMLYFSFAIATCLSRCFFWLWQGTDSKLYIYALSVFMFLLRCQVIHICQKYKVDL